MNKIKTIATLIETQNKIYLRDGYYHILPEEGNIKANPSHINNGFCYHYANDLHRELSSLEINCEIIEVNHLEIPHAFIKIDNLFYDSETPYGVKTYEELPLFSSQSLVKKETIFQKIFKKRKF